MEFSERHPYETHFGEGAAERVVYSTSFTLAYEDAIGLENYRGSPVKRIGSVHERGVVLWREGMPVCTALLLEEKAARKAAAIISERYR